MKITWLGHSSVKIETGDTIIYIDPYAGDDAWYTNANIVLVSQWHYDHCSTEKIRKIGKDAHVVGTTEVASQFHPCSVLRPGESKIFGDIEVVGMSVEHDYVEHRGHVHEPHSRIGFVIVAEKKKVYFMGGGDFMPQLDNMQPDVLLIAVGGTYTAGAKRAAETAKKINPKLAIPIHWGAVAGTRDDAELFKELAGIPVEVLNPGESVEV